jgi:hypothetical protein
MPEFFPLSPASAKPFWVLVGVGIFLVALAAVFFWFGWKAREVRFEISSAGLKLAGDLYGRMIPAKSLQLDAAKRVNLGEQQDLQLKWRTFGTGLPGYRAGWFKLRNGSKALVYLTDPSNVVMIPTTEGFTLLLNVADPNRFLTRLREVCGR